MGSSPSHVGALPESVRGLVLAVKAYERSAIRAAIEKSWPMALAGDARISDHRAMGNRAATSRDVEGGRPRTPWLSPKLAGARVFATQSLAIRAHIQEGSSFYST